FNSKTTSLVRVAAIIPAGARKGDAVDVFLTVPESSRTSSLRGGELNECVLYNYDSTGRINAAAGKSTGDRQDSMPRGHPLAQGGGTVIAGVVPPGTDEPPSLKTAVVWGSGRYTGPDLPFILEINPDQQYARVAMRIAERVNETFHGPMAGAGAG